ncbi:protein phosphatase 2C domain-containing protein [Mycolicibacterium aubagnense]
MTRTVISIDTETSISVQDCYGGTHQGRVRPINEDRFLCRADLNVWAVADGMGGHAHGDIASSAIIQSIAEQFEGAKAHGKVLRAFSNAVQTAHDRIRAISEANDKIVMGSTVAGLILAGGRFHIPWTGDSRVYLIRNGRITQMTRDHTEVQMLLRENAISEEEARNWPRKNVILHAIGVNEAPYVEAIEGEVEAGDTFILCTDGLTAHLADQDIQILVTGNTAQRACIELVRVALERGGKDNVTVVVVNLPVLAR